MVLDTDKVFHGIHVGFPINIVNAVQEMGIYGWNPDISLCSVEEYNHVNLEDFIYLIHIQKPKTKSHQRNISLGVDKDPFYGSSYSNQGSLR